MYKYKVKFAHEDENATSEEERHGAGMIDIETDHLVESREDLVEIARTIGKKNGYTKVVITAIVQEIEDEEAGEDASVED